MKGRVLFASAHFLVAGSTLAAGGAFVTTSDNIRIRYVQAGKAQPGRPALLFVPGWTMAAEIWEPQISHFSKSRRVVAMVPRSQGGSSKPADGNYPATRARDIRAVVDRLKLAPVVLIGWSMGVTELASYVDQFGNDTLAGLVLVDGIAGAAFDPQVSPVMLRWAASLQVDRRKTTEAFVRSMFRKLQSEPYLRALVETSLKTPTNSAVALFLGSFTTDNRTALARIKVPTLIVRAAGSPWTAAFEELHERIKGSRLETMEGVGHALFVDDAAGFNALLDEFLSRIRH